MQDHSLAGEPPTRSTVTPPPPLLSSGIRPWTDSRYERLYDPGQAPVYPLPQRDPMRALADWGAPPEPPIRPYPLDDERAYASPGPPPWVSRRKTPAWAVAAILVGSVLLLVVAAVIAARVSG